MKNSPLNHWDQCVTDEGLKGLLKIYRINIKVKNTLVEALDAIQDDMISSCHFQNGVLSVYTRSSVHLYVLRTQTALITQVMQNAFGDCSKVQIVKSSVQ